MKQCHVCLYMCDDEAEICPICGAELLEEQAQEDKTSPETEDEVLLENPVIAASADSPVTAEIFKDILTENGIAYSIDEKGDIMHTGFGGSYFAIDIYVDEKDLDLAKELYRNLSENEVGFDDFGDFDSDFDGEDL
ncbi:MAG: DUF2007 domain-containing protein [Clostridia bacterium]|nr:DUF2007 domain-containing protein [Clostridia bacterium]